MFVKVKDLVAMIDTSVKYVNEAKVSHNNVSEEEYKAYISKMKTVLFARLAELKRISKNEKLIAKYENIINGLF